MEYHDVGRGRSTMTACHDPVPAVSARPVIFLRSAVDFCTIAGTIPPVGDPM